MTLADMTIQGTIVKDSCGDTIRYTITENGNTLTVSPGDDLYEYAEKNVHDKRVFR